MPYSKSSTGKKPGYKLALAAFFLALVVVMLGAFTRLVDAGLGCPDWPGCYGHLTWPDEHHEITKAEELFPHAPVEVSKTWPEMVHRYFAGTLGVLILVIAVIAWRHREQRDYPFRLPIFLLFVVVWQALFGMWTVTLKLWPQVVTLHLLGGMSVLSLLWLLINRLGNVQWTLPTNTFEKLHRLRPLLIFCMAVVALQILLGGWTTSNYAAFGCPDFPTCHGEWLPPMDMSRGFDFFQTIGPNYLGGQLENDARVAIHFSHRIGAIAVTLAVIILGLKTLMVNDARLKALVWVIFAALAVQVGLGITNVLFKIPLPIAVAHNAGAGVLMLTIISLASRVWMAKSEDEEQA